MKFEKINDNQIKCILNKFDLNSRKIDLNEFAYGTPKARELFQDMMRQAADELGFVADNNPIMIEAIPVASDCIVLIVTKVSDPEELDTRFSHFSPDPDDDEYDDFHDDADGWIPRESSGGDLVDYFDYADSVSGENSVVTAKSDTTRIFKFDNIDDACDAAKDVSGSYIGSSSLRKKDGSYYLTIRQGAMSKLHFNTICNILSEYGELISGYPFPPYGGSDTIIIKEHAICKLSHI